MTNAPMTPRSGREAATVTSANRVVSAPGAVPSASIAAASDQPLAFSKNLFAAQPTIAGNTIIHTPGGAAIIPVIPVLIHVGTVVVGPLPVGTPRSQLTAPVSPVVDPNDRVLFEQADDPDKKLYVARYHVAQQTVSGASQFRMALQQKPGEQTWTLTVHLEKSPAPELGPAARDAAELAPTALVVLLRFRAFMDAGAAGEVERPFQEVTGEDGGIRAVLNLASIGEMNQVYQALTDNTYGTKLIVRRTIKVGIPNGQPMTPASGIVSSGSGILRGTWLFSFDRGAEGTAGDVWWEQHTATQRTMQPRGNAAIVNLGRVDFDALIPSQLQGLNYGKTGIPANADASNQLVNGDVFAVHTNGGNYAKVKVVNYDYNLTIQWVTYQPGASAGDPLYREVALPLEQLVEPVPFVFPPAVNGNIFGGVTGDNQRPGLVRHIVVGQGGKPYSYYQDEAQPYRFYYLPDSFKIARSPKAPYLPAMRISVNNPDSIVTSVDDVQMTLAFAAAPVVDPDRLKAASDELKRHMTDPLPAGVSGPSFATLPVGSDKLRFRLALPPTGLLQLRDGSRVDLRDGILDTLILGANALQSMFDALMGAAIVLFQGEVDIDLGPDNRETVPFSARMSDLAGELFEYQVALDTPEGGIKVSLRNAIESPLRINRLNATLYRGASSSTGQVSGLTPGGILKPGDELLVTISPSTPLTGDGPPTVVFDLDGVEVQPERETVLNAIFDPATPATYRHKITVQTVPSTFDPQAQDPVVAVLVKFERGDSVLLEPTTLKADATVRLPIIDWLARKEDPGQYRYRVTVIRRSGQQTADSDWRTDTSTILFPNLSR